MRIRRKGIYLALAALMTVSSLLAAGCGGERPAEKTQADAPESIDGQVEEILASMTTTEKIGQMVMIGIQGKTLDEDARTMLSRFQVGGIVYFDRNIESADQLKRLSQDLQHYATDSSGAGEKVPLFLSIDEEGGDVVRGATVIRAPRSQKEIGVEGKPELEKSEAEKIGAELRQYGINMNFAPVADVSASSTRSFSSQPQQTASFVEAAADGYEHAGLLYTLKHFPGLGRGRTDTHQDIAVVDASRETLLKQDMLPFKAIIQKRHPEDYLVMVSHILYTQLDSAHVASQSSAVMTQLLRGELGYQGIIITDDLEMGAVAKYAPMRELSARAVEAGADIVLVCHDVQKEQEACLGIKDAVDRGEISEERLNESVRRILKAKLTHKLQP